MRLLGCYAKIIFDYLKKNLIAMACNDGSYGGVRGKSVRTIGASHFFHPVVIGSNYFST